MRRQKVMIMATCATETISDAVQRSSNCQRLPKYGRLLYRPTKANTPRHITVYKGVNCFHARRYTSGICHQILPKRSHSAAKYARFTASTSQQSSSRTTAGQYSGLLLFFFFKYMLLALLSSLIHVADH